MKNYFFRADERTYMVTASSSERAEIKLTALGVRVERLASHPSQRPRGAEHGERRSQHRRRLDKDRAGG